MKSRIERWTAAECIAWAACSTALAWKRPRGESAGVLEAQGRMAASGIDPCSRPVGKSGNCCLSRILCLRAPSRLKLLSVNSFQLKQSEGFPGFPGNFPGVCMAGGRSKPIDLGLDRVSPSHEYFKYFTMNDLQNNRGIVLQSLSKSVKVSHGDFSLRLARLCSAASVLGSRTVQKLVCARWLAGPAMEWVRVLPHGKSDLAGADSAGLQFP